MTNLDYGLDSDETFRPCLDYLRKKKFLVAHRFPRTSLSENRALLGTDNVRGQISEHIFAPNGDYCLYSIQCKISVIPPLLLRKIPTICGDLGVGVTID